jgi:pimeloyl-ACP methyl ester carboxylesterase
VHSVADHLPQTPVIIGHSLGGFVVQKYLESHVAPAGVLVASTPPQGAAAAVLRTADVVLRKMAQHPWLTAKAIVTGEPLPGFNRLERARSMFFSAHTPESCVARYAQRLQTEQAGSAALDMVFLNLPKPHRVSTPVLVLGAQCDRSVTPREVRATARGYHAQAEIFPNMGHDMMLEPGWAAVARRIHTWLRTRGL